MDVTTGSSVRELYDPLVESQYPVESCGLETCILTLY
jgi:hypothetical protein